MAYIVMLFITIPIAYIWKMYSEKTFSSRKLIIKGKYALKITTYFWTILTFAPLYCIYAFQYSLHSDYDNYQRTFLQIKSGTGYIREIAVNYINKLVAISNLDFQFVYVIIYLIAFFILAKCLKDYSKDYAVSLLLFVTLFFVLGFLQIRQLVAVIISLYSYRFIAENKFTKFFIVILVACMFHVSAVIMLPAYFILKYDFKCSYYVIVTGIFGIITLFQTQVLTWIVKTFVPSYYGRHEMFRSIQINKWDMITILTILFLCAIYYNRVKQVGYNRVFINGLFIYTLLFFLGRWIIEFERFGYYFYFPVICLIPNMMDCEKNISFKLLMKIGICLMTLMFWLIRYQGSEMFHYVSIFNA